MKFDLMKIPRDFTLLDVMEDGLPEELILNRRCILGLKSEKNQYVVYTTIGRFILSNDPHRIIEILANEEAESEKQIINRAVSTYKLMIEDMSSAYAKEIEEIKEKLKAIENKK